MNCPLHGNPSYCTHIDTATERRNRQNIMRKDKLLFLGADTSAEDAVRYAQSKGVYTIVTDYRPVKNVPAKMLADEAWMLDVADLDAIEKRCRAENVTAAFAGNHEFCLDQCKILCGRLHFPFYASNDGWEAARNKAIYKNICTECGLDTPDWCMLNEGTLSEAASRLKFPIVVKPADSCAQQGLTVVYHPEDLLEAYKKAVSFSASKEVLAEEFIDGTEIKVSIYIHENQIYTLSIFEDYLAEIKGRKNFGLVVYNGRFNPYIQNEMMPKFTRVVQKLGCREGPCMFQCIYRDGILYNIELCYRLDGVLMWRQHKKTFGISELELLVDFSLGNPYKGEIAAFRFPEDIFKTKISYFIWAEPGKVEKIKGLDELYNRKDVCVQLDRFKEGDIIPDLDNMRSIAYVLTVYGNDHQELDRKIREINSILHIQNQDGKDMLIYLEGYYEAWQASMNGDLNQKYYAKRVRTV